MPAASRSGAIWALALWAVAGCRHEAGGVSPDAQAASVVSTHRAAGDSSVTRAAHDGGSPDAAVSTPRLLWGLGYAQRPLDAELRSELLVAAASTEVDRAAGAAFVLGRRLSTQELAQVSSILPFATLTDFARGVAGRPLGSAPRDLGVLARLLSLPHARQIVAVVVSRFRLVLSGESLALIPRLLASLSLADQCAGARLLDASNAPVPAVALLTGLHPVALVLAAQSLQHHAGVASSLWTSLLDVVSARVRANPRAWANSLLALSRVAPSTDPFVRERLIGLPSVLEGLDLQPIGVSAAFRCALALRADQLDNGVRTARCASGPDRWQSLVAQVELMGDRPTLQALRRVLSEAPDDVRVREAVARSVVKLPPAAARPLVLLLSETTDPGVLAALLEALVLHVQHLRALPEATREALLQRPFELPEAVSLEARIQSIRLQRRLGRRPVVSRNSVRAITVELDQDATVAPAGNIGHEATEVHLRLVTSVGVVVIALDASTAPAAVQTVLAATRARMYDSTVFHRVVPGFVAQGGDPRGDGYGGVSEITPTELSGATFSRGSVGIALAGLDTGGRGFFITLSDTPQLDGQYPFVGKVIEGMGIVDSLMTGDTIISATVE